MAAEDATVSLLEMARARANDKGPDCGVAVALRSHPRATELRDLLSAVESREIRFSVAAEVCKLAGLNLRADTLSRHTRGKCACS